MSLTTSPPVYQVRPRKDKRGVDLISDALSIWSPVVWRAGCSQQRSRLRQVFQPSRATRLGRHYPNREHLLRVQGRGPVGLVGNPDVHPVRQLHHRDHSVHRYSQEFRQRRRLRDWADFAAGYFLPNSRLRQRAISRRRYSDYDRRSAATATTRAARRAALIIGPRLASVFR